MSYTYEITTAGKALIAKAQIGAVINFTKVVVGKGDLIGSPAEFTSLLDPVSTNAKIQQKEYIEGSEEAKITITYTNDDIDEGFEVKEIGLFANDPDVGEILFLYCYTEEADYLPPFSYASVEQVVNLMIAVDNASEVIAQILPETNVIRNNFYANSILKADLNSEPEALVIEENRIVGRKTGGKIDDLTTTEVRDMLDVTNKQETIDLGKLILASVPAAYERERFFKCNGGRSLTVFANTIVNIDGKGYFVKQDTEVTYSQSKAIAGKDLYLYACVPTAGDLEVPVLILSNLSTFPSGYTADTTRKIGGVHCICNNIAVGDPLFPEGMQGGDFLPQSLWDLKFRAISKDGNEGMTYDDRLGKWVDIYKPSKVSFPLAPYTTTVDSSGNPSVTKAVNKYVSRFNGDVANYTHYDAQLQGLGLAGKRTVSAQEFALNAEGSPEQATLNINTQVIELGCNMEQNYGGGILRYRNLSAADNNNIQTALRSPGKKLMLGDVSQLTSSSHFDHFGVEGIRRYSGSGGAGQLNTNSYAYECIKLPHRKLGVDSSNTYPTINWQYNKHSGYAFAQFEGTGTARRIYHNMGKKPVFMIIKNIETTDPWVFYQQDMGDIHALEVGNTSGKMEYSSITDVNDEYFQFDAVTALNGEGDDIHIYALFAEEMVDPDGGYGSGKIWGNDYMACGVRDCSNSIPGVFRFGFTPDYVMIKRIDGIGDWQEYRRKRGWNNYTVVGTGTSAAETISLSEMKIIVDEDNDNTIKISNSSPHDGRYMVIAYKEDWKTYSSVYSFGGPTTSSTTVVQKVFNGIDTVNNPDTEVLTIGKGYDVTSHTTIQASDKLGMGNYLRTNETNSGGFVGGTPNYIREYTATGFNVGGASNYINGNKSNHFCFKTDEKVSLGANSWNINRKLGFAWTVYKGDATGEYTQIQHPCGVKPYMIWNRTLNNVADDWTVWAEGDNDGYIMKINDRNGHVSNTSYGGGGVNEPNAERIVLSAVRSDPAKHYILMIYFRPTEETGVAYYEMLNDPDTSQDLVINTGVENPKYILRKIVDYVGHDWRLVDANTDWNKVHYLNVSTASGSSNAVKNVTSDGVITLDKGSLPASGRMIIQVFGEKNGHFKAAHLGGSGKYVSQTGGFYTHGDSYKNTYRRMISRSGVEDCLGTTWTLTDTPSAGGTESSVDALYGIDGSRIGGSHRSVSGLILLMGGILIQSASDTGTGEIDHTWRWNVHATNHVVRGICDSTERKPE